MRNDAGAREGVRGRLTAAAAHRRGRTALRALSVVLLGLVAVFGVGSPAGAADGGDLVKVFVVKDPAQSGEPLADLPSIAASTLGDAARAGEILQLNKGLAQPDGGALNTVTDQLHPGWILRLPQDASGPDVQLAKDTGAQAGSGQGGRSGAATPPAAAEQDTAGGQPPTVAKPEYLTLPLPAALGAAGAVLAALVTAAILGRRQIGRMSYGLGRAVRRLGDPARRRRRLQARRALAERFAADTESVRRAYGTLDEFGAAARQPAAPIHALRVDSRGVTVWVTPTESVPDPWRKVDETRWRRSAGGSAPFGAGPARTTAAQASGDAPCLVRVGSDDEGEQVFVDLSRLDGVLSVTGEHAVARDVVRTVLGEIARSRPGTPVTVLRGTDGAPPIEVPEGLEQRTRVEEGRGGPLAAPTAALRAAAARRPVRGVVVMAGTPTAREAAELESLCGPGGAGWTGLVCGEAEGAHWRWHTDADGGVDIPVLGVRLTVPA
ncbi:hypothetical protein [Streptomyces sp. NBC_01497]|uniref:hypothetical protein n=1 Tax=Streptomyces sp. NBC_01497 TaxID=2903885 RepID=UPI002E33E60A|nr:hypothetical protein [Streptomyces sp. NBC_01497]